LAGWSRHLLLTLAPVYGRGPYQAHGAPLIPHKRVGGPRSDPTADGTVRHAVTSQHVITVARTPTSVNWRAELPYPSWAGLWTRHYALGGCPSEFVRLRRFPVFSFSYSRGHSDYFGPKTKIVDFIGVTTAATAPFWFSWFLLPIDSGSFHGRSRQTGRQAGRHAGRQAGRPARTVRTDGRRGGGPRY
jgi:hypothetical protein